MESGLAAYLSHSIGLRALRVVVQPAFAGTRTRDSESVVPAWHRARAALDSTRRGHKSGPRTPLKIMRPPCLSSFPANRPASRLTLVLVLLAAGAFLAPAADTSAKTSARGVTRVAFEGWPDALRLESRDAKPRAVLVPGLGGRVMSYGLGDENLLWVNPETAGKTLASDPAGFEPGGFFCDIGPEVAALPPHPALVLGPWEWSVKKTHLLALKTDEDKTLGVELEKLVMFDPATGDLGFEHRVKNTRERDSALCFWHRIALKPGGYVLVPVNKKSRFPSGWSVQKTTAGKLAWDSVSPAHDNVKILDGVLVARTGSGGPVKIGVDSDAQWAAYAIGRTLFIAHFPYYSTAIYSEGGNSVAIGWDDRRTELQPMAPEARLRSRKSNDFPIKWSLVELPAEVTTPEEARALADKVPASPFQ